ncbi:tetratricopeptide repeat protein [Pseudomonadales bacterium]|nr:tetratricopeptide repeat protein [Pseudomonadales bacterium]MDC0893922.1 tetratricopeptide repeat protein [Pseudomonadales bacterium]
MSARWYFIGVFFNCVFLAGCSPEAPAPNVDRHLESGRTYYEQGQYNASMIEARSALQIDGSNEAANLLMSDIYLSLGMARQALQILQSIDSDSYDYNLRLIDAMLAVGKYGTSLHLLRQSEGVFAGNEIESLLRVAEARIGLRDIESASLSYRKVLDLDASNIDATLGLIAIDATTGSLERADAGLLALLENHPEHLDTLILLANVYLRQGRFEEAESRLTDAISVLPSTDIFTQQRAGLLRVLIRLLAFQGNSAEALIYQNQLAAAFPNAEELQDRMAKVAELIENAEFESALTVLDEIELIAPGNESTGTLRGVIAFLQGDNQAAGELFKENVDPEIASSKTMQLFAANQFYLDQPHQVVALLRDKVKDTRNPETLALFGVAALAADATQEGVAALRKAIDLQPDNVRLSIILASHLRINDPAQALKELEAAYARKSDDLYLNLALMTELVELGDTARAADLVAMTLSNEQQSFATQFLAARYYARVGQPQQAINYYQKASDYNDTDLRPLLSITSLLTGLGRYDEAEEQVNNIIRLNKNSLEAYQGLLSIYVARNERSEGVALLSSMAEENEVSEPLLVLSNFFAKTGDASEAETFLVEAGSGNGKSDRLWRTVNASIYAERAQLSYQSGKFDEARSFVFTALNSYPANKQLLGMLISIELGAGALDEAKKVLEELKQVHPESQLGMIRGGDIFVAEGQLDDAMHLYVRAWSIRVDDRLGQKLYEVYQQLDEREKASQLLAEWRAAIPMSVPAMVNRAIQLAANDSVEAALAAYEGFLKVRPGSIVIKNNLAWLYLESGRYNKAVEVSKEAHELMPTGGAVADTYGWALYKKGDIAEAISVLRLAVKLLPNDKIQAHLDEALSTEKN